MKKKTCYDCAYRMAVPGSVHTRCGFKWGGSGLEKPAGQEHGIKNGWFLFPLNFDPVWMIGDCPALSDVQDKDKVTTSDPLQELISIFGGKRL